MGNKTCNPTPTPSSSIPLKEGPDATRKRNAIYTSQHGTEDLPRPCWHLHVRREEADRWRWDVELIREKQQKVVLTLSLLLEWLIYDFYDFDDFLRFDADEELKK